MKNSPVISNFDLGVFGNPSGPVFGYRRVRNVGDDVVALGPDEEWDPNAYFAVYRWDDEKAQWSHYCDDKCEFFAIATAAAAAGTRLNFGETEVRPIITGACDDGHGTHAVLIRYHATGPYAPPRNRSTVSEFILFVLPLLTGPKDPTRFSIMSFIDGRHRDLVLTWDDGGNELIPLARVHGIAEADVLLGVAQLTARVYWDTEQYRISLPDDSVKHYHSISCRRVDEVASPGWEAVSDAKCESAASTTAAVNDPSAKEIRIMKNTPNISHLDIAAFGTTEGTVASYRRVIDGSEGTRSMTVDEPETEGQYYSVYRWEDNVGPDGEWQWGGDAVLEAEARVAAIKMAGTDTPFKPD